MVNLVYLSEMLDKPIVDLDGAPVGKLKDLVLSPTGEKFPEISGVVFKPACGGKPVKLGWADVNRCDKTINLGVGLKKLKVRAVHPNDILLAKYLMDQQLVDIDGLKVVRVNDIALGEAGDKFCVVSIDVGTKGLLRRLGLEWLADRLALKERLIPWSLTEPLQPKLRRIKLSIPRHKISDLHPADIASVMTELSHYERELIMKTMDSGKIADTLTKMDINSRAVFFNNLEHSHAVEIFKRLSPDEAADLLAAMAPERAKTVIDLMEEDLALDITELMKHQDHSVGSIMSMDFFTLTGERTVRQTLNLMRKHPDRKVFSHVYVVDDSGRFRGAVSLRSLIMAKPSERLDDLLLLRKGRLIKIHPHSGKAKAARLMAKYDFITLPVVDSKGRLVGVVTADDALSAILPPKVTSSLPHFFSAGWGRGSGL